MIDIDHIIIFFLKPANNSAMLPKLKARHREKKKLKKYRRC